MKTKSYRHTDLTIIALNNNKYISKALNPSISDLHEAQNAVYVELKLRQQRNQRHPEQAGDGRVKGQGPSTGIDLHDHSEDQDLPT